MTLMTLNAYSHYMYTYLYSLKFSLCDTWLIDSCSIKRHLNITGGEYIT